MLLDERVTISPTSPVATVCPSPPTILTSTPGTGLPAARMRGLPLGSWSSGGSITTVPVVSVMP